MQGKWVSKFQPDYSFSPDDIVMPNEVLGFDYNGLCRYIPLGYKIAPEGPSLADELIAERREEASRE